MLAVEGNRLEVTILRVLLLDNVLVAIDVLPVVIDAPRLELENTE